MTCSSFVDRLDGFVTCFGARRLPHSGCGIGWGTACPVRNLQRKAVSKNCIGDSWWETLGSPSNFGFTLPRRRVQSGDREDLLQRGWAVDYARSPFATACCPEFRERRPALSRYIRASADASSSPNVRPSSGKRARPALMDSETRTPGRGSKG